MGVEIRPATEEELDEFKRVASIALVMMPPSAQWYVEACEKIVDIYLRYADTFDVDLTEDTRFGYTRKGRSFYISIVDDEMSRRLQEMGKLGPGLPKQDG